MALIIDAVDDGAGAAGLAAFDGNTQMTNRVQVLAT